VLRRVAPLALLALAACRPDCTPRGGDPAPIVLLVTVDTLRADHLGPYGATAVRTPGFDALAAESLTFEQSYSAANVTLPSHLSLLTSLPLARHGVLSNHAAAAPPVETLPGQFARAGYRTAAFVSALHLGPTMLLGDVLRGIDRHEGPERAAKPLRAEETTDRLLGWLRGACRGPAFGWLHLWDPHMPYVPPAPFEQAYYAGDPRDPRHTSMRDVELEWVLYDLSQVRPLLRRHVPTVRALKRRFGVRSKTARRLILWPETVLGLGHGIETYREVRAEVAPVARDLRRRLPYRRSLAAFLTGVRDAGFPVAQYKGEVAYADREIDRLRRTLVDWGLSSRVVLLVTADHGEGLGEHDVWLEHAGLWEEIVRVPLQLWAPGRVAPGRREDVVSGLDVAPTLLRLAGLPVPAAMEGRDLLAGPVEGPVVVEQVKGIQIAVRDGRWKLIRTLKTFTLTGTVGAEAGTERLFDVTHDPGERHDLWSEDPEARRALAATLDRWMVAHGLTVTGEGYPQPAAPPVPPERVDQLRALGYVE
jgi:arylsulfatase A-like enzyme